MVFRAIMIEQEQDGGRVRSHRATLREVEDDTLGAGKVTVNVEYSGVNYKDAMALAGRPGIVQTSPLIPGIDLVGTVSLSMHPAFSPGDTVILNGAGIGESIHGGLAERARVSADSLVRLPGALSTRQAALIGTAGFTAMLAVLALEGASVAPGDGPVLVTGASGGLGSYAVAILSRLGYRVTASTGRRGEADYLRRLGAAEVIERLDEAGKPMQKQRWAGAIDGVGGTTLANVIAQTRYGGTVAACGLAGGAELPTTVLPFILRAVTLTGINSVDAPTRRRDEAWERLATDLDAVAIDDIGDMVGLGEAIDAAEEVLAGRTRGHLAVDVHA